MRIAQRTPRLRGLMSDARLDFTARGSRLLDYGFLILYVLLGTRLTFALLAPQASDGFVQFIDRVSGPFYTPFLTTASGSSAVAGSALAMPVLIALVLSVLVQVGLHHLQAAHVRMSVRSD